MNKIILKGRIPSKKNRLVRWTAKNGRTFISPDKIYKEWHEMCSWQLKSQKAQPVSEVKSVEIVIYAPDNRKSDLTNKIESIMDLLVDNKIIVDDNWFIVGDMHLKFGGVDKVNPRAEIVIN